MMLLKFQYQIRIIGEFKRKLRLYISIENCNAYTSIVIFKN
jgi:hypothetical protein